MHNAAFRIGFCIHLFKCGSSVGPLHTKAQAQVVGEMACDGELYKPEGSSLLYADTADDWFRPVGRVSPCLVTQQKGKEEWQRMRQ